MKAREVIVAALCLGLAAWAPADQRPGPVVPGAAAGRPGVDGVPRDRVLYWRSQGLNPNSGILVNPYPALPHFAYVVEAGLKPDNSPAQQLRLAQITDPSPPTGPTATDFKTLLDTANPDGSGLSTIDGLWASPGNLRLLAFVIELGPDFLDQNLQVWDMADGKASGFANEFSAIQVINRKTCQSPVFDAYLAQLKMQGVAQSDLDSIDYSIPINGPADQINLPGLQIQGWLDDTHVGLLWTVPFWTTYDDELQDTFQLIVTFPQAGGAPSVACAAQLPGAPHPPTALTLSAFTRVALNKPTIRTTFPMIRLHGIPMKWTSIPVSQFIQPAPLPPPHAKYLAGVIWP